jgi:hypothetical protein
MLRGGAGAKAAASRWGSRPEIDRSKPPHFHTLLLYLKAYKIIATSCTVTMSQSVENHGRQAMPRRITVPSRRKFRCDR